MGAGDNGYGPPRIALIAVRTGPGDVASNTGIQAQAIVVGEVPLGDPSAPNTEWEWRYALFNLADLERLLARANRDIANGKPWQDILHPLDGPAKLNGSPYSAAYWDKFGPDAPLLLGNAEKQDLLSSGDLPAPLIAALQEPIKPYVNDSGTTSTTAVSRLNFSIPLRDVARLMIYDKVNQPIGPAPNAVGPLMVLDTCRLVKTNGSSYPEQPAEPSNDPLGSRIILFTDPLQVATQGPDKYQRVTAQGKLAGFAVFAQVRLPLNGHDTYDGEEHGLVRLYAVRAGAQRYQKSIFARVPPKQTDPPGPLFDSMRVGYTLGSGPDRYIASPLLNKYLGELNQPNARVSDPAQGTFPAKQAPILDQLNIGFTLDSIQRTIGFRFIDNARMVLRFEAIYFVANHSDLNVKFAPPLGLSPRNVGFALEQPSIAINWLLPPSSSVQWIFTARNHPADFATDDGITKAVIAAFNSKVDTLHAALRQAQDASPISLLPHLSERDGDKVNGKPLVPTSWHDGAGAILTSPAWHFVGYLIDRKPYSQKITLFALGIARSLREIDAEFFTLEPRFIADMFHGEDFRFADPGKPKGPFGLTGTFGILADAYFPRLTLTSNDSPTYEVVLSAPIITDPSEANPPPWIGPPAFQPAVSGRGPADAYRGVMLGIKIIKKTSDSAHAQIGALEIALATGFPDDSQETDGLLRLLALKTDADKTVTNTGIDALIKLPLDSAVPGGQDDLPDSAQITAEDRVLDALPDPGPDPDAPLLLPLKAPAIVPTQLTLYANETVSRHRNHTVDLSLKAIQSSVPQDDDGTGQLLVIDPAPFRIAVVKTRDLAAAQTNEADEVAVWNAAAGSGLSWRIVDDAGTVSLLLPPQVIGEAMEKNRADADGRPPDISEAKPVPARIGSATRLDLDPSHLDTRYIEPGWNLRRIMGYPGQSEPGAGLRDLRLELMYGIVTRLTPSAPSVRVAEIGAVIGAPATSVSADSQSLKVRDYIQSFNAARVAQNRRLAVDRLWQGNPLDELTIEQDASFQLRTKGPQSVAVTVTVAETVHLGDTLTLVITPNGGPPVTLSTTITTDAQTAANELAKAVDGSSALAAVRISAGTPSAGTFNLQFASSGQSVSASVTGAGATAAILLNGQYSTVQSGPLTAFRWPIPGGVPSDLDASLKDTFSDTADDSKSFPGGVPWAFESSNILRSVYRKPAADGGRARSVHLSALGGWGNQRGLFDQKKSAIETETTMGRVHRYALERIGRIGALWNRAKHIIVYERSVVPSAQFYNTDPIGKQQDQLLGRPVLRKVEEYVELLEQIRRYPEQGNAIEAAGCLTGVEFVTKRIRVDSRWGGDVRAEGWQVPLWNKAFDRPPENPDNPDDPTFVYPKPQIRFLVMGEGNVEKALEIAEPEKLIFYTSVVVGETGDNTDAWHPVRDVDFVDLPVPQSPKRDPQTDDLHDGMLPPEPEHVPGYERLTIGLVPTTEPVAFTYGRQDKGPVALLHNVTIARATTAPPPKPATGPAKPAPSDVVAKVGDAISSFRLGLDALTGQLSEAARVAATTDGADRDKVKQVVRDAAAGLASKIGGLTDKFKQAENKWPDRKDIPILTKRLCAEQTDRVAAEIDAQSNAAINQINQLFGEVDGALNAEVDEIHLMAAQIRAQITNPQAQSKAFLAGLSTRLTDLAGSASASASQANGNADAIANQVGAGVSSIISTVEFQKNSAADAINSALDALAHHPPDAGKYFDAATSAIRAGRGQIGQLLVNASSNALPQATRTVLLVLDQALSLADASIGKAKSKWSQGIAGAQQDATAAQSAVQDISSALDARAALNATGTLVSSVTGALDGVGQRAQGIIDGLLQQKQDQIQALIGQIDTLPTAQIATQLDALAADVISVPISIQQSFQADLAALQSAVGTAKGALINGASQVCAKFEGVIDVVYDSADQAKTWLDDRLAGYQDQLDQALGGISDDVAELAQNAQDAVTQVGREMEARARETLGGLQQRAADYLNGRDPSDVLKDGENAFQQGSDTLRLFRALGDPPKTDQLGFNRPQVAYVFQEANKIVDMTPAIALVNRVADSAAALGAAAASANNLLTSFGIRLPASAIGDQLMPDALKTLDISKLFPDFSGIKLDGLFKNLGFPSLSDSDAVKVRHGFDQTELTAWLEADIDVPFAESAPLMDFGPVQIMIDDARFTASARLSEGRAGTQKTMSGMLFGDWRVVCVGQTFLTFQQTSLTFDQSGRINFNIQPDRVELADALQFLTDLVEATGQDGDFEIVPYMSGGVPSGVAARLDMELPPIQTGVFGISDLSLHLLFGVSAIPEFEIVTELAVGSQLAPFTLNIWILNGGGFVTSRLSYLPMHPRAPLLIFTLEVGIVAGVGLGFSFGVVSGGVWIQVGCAIAITWTTGAGGSTTAVTVFLLVRGNVDVAGLITVGLSLLLAITYDGSQMIASGTLTLSIKISVFYTLSVSEHVEYNFAGGKKESRSTSYSDSYA